MMPPHSTPPRERHLFASDGFGSLTSAPTTSHRRPASRFFCLEAPLSWRPARHPRSLATPPALPGGNPVRPTPHPATLVP